MVEPALSAISIFINISYGLFKFSANFKGKCVCKTISHICRSTTSNFMNKDDQEALLVILCLIGFITVYKFIKKVNLFILKIFLTTEFSKKDN